MENTRRNFVKKFTVAGMEVAGIVVANKAEAAIYNIYKLMYKNCV
jgi:hypothetical protein